MAKCYLVFKIWCLPLTKSIGRSILKLHFDSDPIGMRQPKNEHFLATYQLWDLSKSLHLSVLSVLIHRSDGMTTLPCDDDDRMG